MYYCIYNPIAGSGNAVKISQRVGEALRAAGVSFEMHATSAPGDAAQLARQAAAQGARAVIAIGGDGTASEAARGLCGAKTALGIIPGGTGNDFIKTIGTPADPMAALEFILKGTPVATDIGLLNDRTFLNVTGTGFDVMVLDYAARAKWLGRGLLPYLWGVICTILHYRPTCLTYSIDGALPRTENVLVCAAANGRIIGGGIPIAPKAQVSDGLMDVVLIRDVKKSRMPLYLVRLLRGKVLEFEETMYCRAKEMTIKAPNMRMNIDGEVVSIEEARLSILPGALLIYR